MVCSGIKQKKTQDSMLERHNGAFIQEDSINRLGQIENKILHHSAKHPLDEWLQTFLGFNLKQTDESTLHWSINWDLFNV